jgi:hypothetical protein
MPTGMPKQQYTKQQQLNSKRPQKSVGFCNTYCPFIQQVLTFVISSYKNKQNDKE